MNLWSLPQTAEIGGVEYHINADFRDVLEIIKYLTDASRPEYLRWQIALGLFYDGEIPYRYQTAAMEYLSEFISYGTTEGKPSPKLVDWTQDAQMIVSDVNKVAGREVRAEKFLHWWTFLSYFNGIGEGQLSTVVSIRSKLQKHKPLEKWEKEYYRDNKNVIDIITRPAYSEKELKFYEAWGGVSSERNEENGWTR